MHRLSVERLVELMEKASPDSSAARVLEMWKQEHDDAMAEHDRQMRQKAIDNPTRYGVKRVEEGLVESSGNMMPVWNAVEHFSVAKNELSAFAHHIRSRADDLIDLVEGRRSELITKSGVYRAWSTPSWSASSDFIDRSDQQAFRAEMEREDMNTRAWVDRWNDNKKKAVKPAPQFPTAINWKGSK